MCGISAIYALAGGARPDLARSLQVMNDLQRHRGRDGDGVWVHADGFVGLGHRRLRVLDLESGEQPMSDALGNAVTHNGEVYNHHEIRDRLGPDHFRTTSDAEAVLHAYGRWGLECLERLNGMFAFAIWDEQARALVCVRDRLGIKPVYYTVVDGTLYVASEMKALLPFLPSIETDADSLEQYRAFHFCLGGRTLFKGIQELPPGHWLRARDGGIEVRQYWALPEARPDEAAPATRDAAQAVDRVRECLDASMALHMISDVGIGAFVSGGLDSSLVAAKAARRLDASSGDFVGVAGGFPHEAGHDERRFAADVATHAGFPLHQVTIDEADFIDHVAQVVYHLDVPVAGPGAFAQFMVSGVASRLRTVMLGGLGGDELFGGYVRYLVAASGGAVDLSTFGDYSAMARTVSNSRARSVRDRYFALIDRRQHLPQGRDRAHEVFVHTFESSGAGADPWNQMMRFDIRASLPALLHVEDRMSMAHGLESRVPLLDHRLVEVALQLPSTLRHAGGRLKSLLSEVARPVLPASVVDRRDKMGFPVPLHRWMAREGPVRTFVHELLTSQRARRRTMSDDDASVEPTALNATFGRSVWAPVSLELWQQAFHDRAAEFRRMRP